MTYKEAKKVLSEWLKERGFERIQIPGGAPYNYVHPLGEFSVLISFYKDRFAEYLIFNVGCHFDDCEYGDATVNVRNLTCNVNKENNRQGFYYEENTEEAFIDYLNEMFDKYLKPYYEKGKAYLKEIVLRARPSLFRKALFKGEVYFVEIGARKKINEMFGLRTKP